MYLFSVMGSMNHMTPQQQLALQQVIKPHYTNINLHILPGTV